VVDNLDELLAGDEQKKWEESGMLIEAPVLEQEKDKA
jgi:hypothetical protein